MRNFITAIIARMKAINKGIKQPLSLLNRNLYQSLLVMGIFIKIYFIPGQYFVISLNCESSRFTVFLTKFKRIGMFLSFIRLSKKLPCRINEIISFLVNSTGNCPGGKKRDNSTDDIYPLILINSLFSILTAVITYFFISLFIAHFFYHDACNQILKGV